MKLLKRRLKERSQEERAFKKKEYRDYKIKNMRVIRTYDYVRGVVINHLNGKKASLKKVVDKGRIDLLK